MSSPCHIEVILTEKEDVVAKPTDDIPRTKKESKRKQRRQLARGIVVVVHRMLQCGRVLLSLGTRSAGTAIVATAAENAVVQTSGKLARSSKEQSRECELAAAFYREGKRSGLRKLMKIVTKQKEVTEATSRAAAFAAALALKLEKPSEAHDMLSHATMTPAVIRRSLLVIILAAEGRLDEAIDEVEKCLQEEGRDF
ncbi:hypothetical protein COOONC_08554 [Cooperia oncophora]